jgi:hypothetical protein
LYSRAWRKSKKKERGIIMRHFIIVKWNDAAKMKARVDEIDALFKKTLEIPGIHSAVVHPSCSDRSNRYDLMIEIGMDAEALPVYDDCEPHHTWKDQYGSEIAHKVIFDCE